jgi:hypothetical protein
MNLPTALRVAILLGVSPMTTKLFAGQPALAGERPRLVLERREIHAPATSETLPPAAPPRGSGMQLFPPPGTKPLKQGIVVPEGFELPAGYMRHYQTTDDGKALPAILVFHPDYDVVDEQGVPIAIPQDRVVPPALAPPGLPIEMLILPDTKPSR